MLGTAAGGGFPQWNCHCPNCRLARTPGSGVLPRLQSSVAIRSDGERWLLLNASPDLSRQMELHFPPKGNSSIRSSPLEGVFLTNADLDHVLGLILLREGEPLKVIAPDGVRETLGDFLRFDDILNAACGIQWQMPTSGWQDSPLAGLEFRAIPLARSSPPRFAANIDGCHGVGYLFRNRNSSQVAGFFPDVAEIDEVLLQVLETCNVVFFDGTFWQENELKTLGISNRTAREMGHIPVADSREKLFYLVTKGVEIFYLHINNTNPILHPQSDERRKIEAAGLRLAEDGMRLHL